MKGCTTRQLAAQNSVKTRTELELKTRWTDGIKTYRFPSLQNTRCKRSSARWI